MGKFVKDDRGSVTIESSLVFPALLIFTLIGVFFCIIVFQMGAASYSAHLAATNVAYVWNNSTKDIETGEFDKSSYPGLPENDTDGLYWRIAEFNFLSFFNLDGFQSGGNVNKKLKKASFYSNGIVSIKEPKYESHILDGKVTVTAESTLFIPAFMKKLLSDGSVKVTSSHVVTETPELIRTHNFAKYLWSEFGVGESLGKATDSISKFFGGS